MVEWEFKRAVPTRCGGWEVKPLDNDQLERLRSYQMSLEEAKDSKISNPVFSKYHVRSCVVSSDKTRSRGGNIEYGLCQALHGEESVVVSFRDSHQGAFFSHPGVLGLIAGAPGNPATPCGNCRDILLDEFGTDFEVVSGAGEGGLALVVKFEDYLFDRFEKINQRDLADWINIKDLESLIKQGRRLEDIPYFDGKVHPERRYFAVVTGKNGKQYVGASEGLVDYHTNYALRDALRTMRKEGGFMPSDVIIIGESESNTPPHVMYKDRQHLLERIDRGIPLSGFGPELDVSVTLINVNPEKFSVVSAWQTSAREWLPMPFTPANLGSELNAHLKEYDEGKRALFDISDS